MNYGYSTACLAHETGTRHPESPDRLRAIKEGLKRRHGVNYITADPVDKATLKTIHSDEYIEELETFCDTGGGEWDPDTVAVEETWDALLTSAGLATWAATQAYEGASGRDTPFSVGRPPGHHAVTDDAMGFCFANNIGIAAETLRSQGASRVAIVDFDVHHGNGTQEIFADRGDVFFASIHEEGIYPGSGAIDEIGTGDGHGRTLNVPLPAGAGDTAYRTVLTEIIEPALAAYDPDVLLVSAGFDAHEHDPISRMVVTTEGYGMIAATLRDIAEAIDAGLGFILEGGYALDVLADSIGKVHEVFDGYEPIMPDGSPDDAVADRLADVTENHPLLD